MVEKIHESLMEDSGYLIEVAFVVIHNDAGSMTPVQYIEWLRNRDKALGIAHYYCSRESIVRVVNTNHIAYHTGDWWSNIRSIGYEVCESMKVSDEEFLENEDMALMQSTEDLLFYGLPITTETVRLHHEFVSTSCPHRSLALHGGTTESVKEYFVTRMNDFSKLGMTVEEMLSNKTTYTIEETNQITEEKTDEELAEEVIIGLWGNGEERKQHLEEKGYSYENIQKIVNEKLL